MQAVFEFSRLTTNCGSKNDSVRGSPSAPRMSGTSEHFVDNLIPRSPTINGGTCAIK